MKNSFKNLLVLGSALSLIFGSLIQVMAIADEPTPTITPPTEPSANTTADSGTAGTESCDRAAQLAAKYGWLTLINAGFASKLESSFVRSINTSLTNAFQNTLNQRWNFSSSTLVTKLFNASGTLLGVNFNNLVGNPLKTTTQAAAQAITDETRKALNQLGLNIGSHLPSVSGITSVPITNITLESGANAISRKQDEIIAQQKKAELLADTRQKCGNLLRQTNDTIKRAILYQLSTQVVDWIVNGREPQFIKQPGQFLEDTANTAVSRLISQVAPRLCQPFRLSVQIAIPTTDNRASPFYEQVACTLPQVIQNIQGFYNDFRSGGWIGYQEVWKPQNNLYGVIMMSEDEALRRQSAATDVAQNDLNQGQGAASQKQCIQWNKYALTGSLNTDQSFGEETEAFLGNVYSLVDTRGPTNDGGPPETGLTQIPSDSGLPPEAYTYSSGDNSYYWRCDKSEITNPGVVASALARNAAQTDTNYLLNSSDVEQFMTTIQDSIINKLTKVGVRGLHNLLPQLPPINL